MTRYPKSFSAVKMHETMTSALNSVAVKPFRQESGFVCAQSFSPGRFMAGKALLPNRPWPDRVQLNIGQHRSIDECEFSGHMIVGKVSCPATLALFEVDLGVRAGGVEIKIFDVDPCCGPRVAGDRRSSLSDRHCGAWIGVDRHPPVLDRLLKLTVHCDAHLAPGADRITSAILSAAVGLTDD